MALLTKWIVSVSILGCAVTPSLANLPPQLDPNGLHLKDFATLLQKPPSLVNVAAEASVSQALEVLVPLHRPEGAEVCNSTLMPLTLFPSSSSDGYYNTFSTTWDPATLPSVCQGDWSMVVLTWECNGVTGVQYDRIAMVFVGGTEVLRTTTAEPLGANAGGTVWSFDKDVTAYASLFQRKQQVYVELDNSISAAAGTTGRYPITLTITVYPATPSSPKPRTVADLVIPVTSFQYSPKYYTGYYGSVSGSHAFEVPLSGLPVNAVRARLDVYATGHNCEEFWYTYPPDGSSIANCGSSTGPFREIQVLLDGVLAGVIWPFPLLYTGAFDPNLWHPLVGIGTFLVPTYTVDLTPFVSQLNDGGQHTVALQVINNLDSGYWFLSGSLLLWGDASAGLSTDPAQRLGGSVLMNGLQDSVDGLEVQGSSTSAARSADIHGTVTTASGQVLTTVVRYSMSFSNTILALGGASQTTSFNKSSTIKQGDTTLFSQEESYNWPLRVAYLLSQASVQMSNDMTSVIQDVSQGTAAVVTALSNSMQSNAMTVAQHQLNYRVTSGTSLLTCYKRQVIANYGGYVLSDSNSATGCSA